MKKNYIYNRYLKNNIYIYKMKFLYILISIFTFTLANVQIEIDIDKLNNTNYKILIDKQYYSCTPKTPPLSHSWSYECISNNRNLRTNN